MDSFLGGRLIHKVTYTRMRVYTVPTGPPENHRTPQTTAGRSQNE